VAFRASFSNNVTNAVTPAILAANHIDISSAAGQSLLSAQVGSALAAQSGFNKVPYAGFATNQTVAQALQRFPQFGNIHVSGAPLGKTWYDSLPGKMTRRYSHGLTLVSTFTWQKSLQAGTDGNANVAYVNNVVQGAQQSKSISSFDQPLLFTITGSYQLPKFAMLTKASYIVQDWQIGTLLSYSSGLPIPVAAVTTSIKTSSSSPHCSTACPECRFTWWTISIATASIRLPPRFSIWQRE
jgi:hypothetical protein